MTPPSARHIHSPRDFNAHTGVHFVGHPFHDLAKEDAPKLRAPWFALYTPFGDRDRYHRVRLDHLAEDLACLQPHTLLGALGHALCALPRYGGQTPHPYSVGVHSLALALYTLRPWFSAIARPHTHSVPTYAAALALVALLHDGPKGLGLGDIISPIKRHLHGATKAWEDAAERDILTALCPSVLEDAPHGPLTSYAAKRAHVGTLDLRILLDESCHILRDVPHPWDDLLGIGPLCLPRGAFLALVALRPQAAALLFVALGMVLRDLAKPLDGHRPKPFAQALEDSLGQALAYAPHGVTQADAYTARMIALALLTDAPTTPDKSPCTFEPAAFLRRAQPYALEDFLDGLRDPHAGSEQAADRLCVWGAKFGFETRMTVEDRTIDGEAVFGVFMHNVHGHSVTFVRTTEENGDMGWDVLDTYKAKTDAQAPAPSAQDLFAEEMPADLYRMALRSHPLSAQGVHLLYLTRLLAGGQKRGPVGDATFHAYHLANKLQAFGVQASVQVSILRDAVAVVIESPHMAGARLVLRSPEITMWCWEERPTMLHHDLAARLLEAEWTVQPCEVL